MLIVPAYVTIPDHPTFRMLQRSAWQFYLTGSRFMQREHAASDWDFFTQDSPDVRRDLLAFGFHDRWGTKQPYSKDQHTVTVYEQVTAIVIQVQLTDCTAAKQFARDYIYVHAINTHELLDNPARTALWNSLYEKYHARCASDSGNSG